MEAANSHDQLHQDHLVIESHPPPSSSSLPTPSSCYGLASSSSTQALTPSPNVTLNAGNFNQSYNGVILNSSNSPRIQESAAGLHWINNSQSAHDHLAKIKDSFPKFTEMVNIPSSNNIEDHSDYLTTKSYLKNQEQKNLNDLSHKLLLQTISPGFPINGNNDQFPAGDFDSSFGNAMPSRGNHFSQIYPSINISNYLNQSSSATSSNNFDMNLQPALDLLSLPFCFDDHLQQSSCRPPRSPSNKISHFTDSSEITEAAKRPSCLMQPKATQQSASKKTRLESRVSCPPFKHSSEVRKEKLGDRIAALQQMVAPFGKTDTASVLMEAIGYIKFLQNQVETLSVPYMKASHSSKSSRTIQGKAMTAENGEEEPKRDLKSRGLCLVPLSCMSYVANDAGAGGAIWPPPPNFGGGT